MMVGKKGNKMDLSKKKIKEFAEKVKDEIDNIRRNAPDRHITVIVHTLSVLTQKINNLVDDLENAE